MMLLIVLVLCASLLVPVSIAAPCDKYKTSDGKECIMCPSGSYKINDCSTSGDMAGCRPCHDNSYQHSCTMGTSCAQCNSQCPYSNMLLVENCTRTSNIRCVCKTGWYWQPDRFSAGEGMCIRHSQCTVGQGVDKPGNNAQDTVCLPCIANLAFSDLESLDRCKNCKKCAVYNRTCLPSQDAMCSKDTNPGDNKDVHSGMSQGTVVAIAVSSFLFAAFTLAVIICCRRGWCCFRNSQLTGSTMTKKNTNIENGHIVSPEKGYSQSAAITQHELTTNVNSNMTKSKQSPVADDKFTLQENILSDQGAANRQSETAYEEANNARYNTMSGGELSMDAVPAYPRVDTTDENRCSSARLASTNDESKLRTRKTPTYSVNQEAPNNPNALDLPSHNQDHEDVRNDTSERKSTLDLPSHNQDHEDVRNDTSERKSIFKERLSFLSKKVNKCDFNRFIRKLVGHDDVDLWIDVVKHDFSNEGVIEQKYQLLLKWYQKFPTSSEDDIIHALEACDLNGVVVEFKTQFGKGDSSRNVETNANFNNKMTMLSQETHSGIRKTDNNANGPLGRDEMIPEMDNLKEHLLSSTTDDGVSDEHIGESAINGGTTDANANGQLGRAETRHELNDRERNMNAMGNGASPALPEMENLKEPVLSSATDDSVNSDHIENTSVKSPALPEMENLKEHVLSSATDDSVNNDHIENTSVNSPALPEMENLKEPVLSSATGDSVIENTSVNSPALPEMENLKEPVLSSATDDSVIENTDDSVIENTSVNSMGSTKPISGRHNV